MDTGWSTRQIAALAFGESRWRIACAVALVPWSIAIYPPPVLPHPAGEIRTSMVSPYPARVPCYEPTMASTPISRPHDPLRPIPPARSSRHIASVRHLVATIADRECPRRRMKATGPAWISVRGLPAAGAIRVSAFSSSPHRPPKGRTGEGTESMK